MDFASYASPPEEAEGFPRWLSRGRRMAWLGALGLVGACSTNSASVGGDADASSPEPSASVDAALPDDYEYLSETGLYADGASGDLAAGVRPYEPRFGLWADFADKRRFVSLPPGTTIDASEPDEWRFPIGTKFWKEFSLDGQLLETRLIEKRSDEYFGWYMRAFLWDATGSDAEVAPDGALDVLDTSHDVPAKQACADCHFGRRDRVLGFGALQLAHAGDGVTLAALVEEERVVPPPPVDLPLPGSDVAVQALGYLHANCGHCHILNGKAWDMTGLRLHLDLDTLSDVEGTPAYVSAVGVEVQKEFGDGITTRIVPGAPESSALFTRMSTRDEERGMPNLATELVDTDAAELIETWIQELAP